MTANPRPVTHVAVGPLTNVALLVARYPEVAARLERIVLMGGAFGEGNTTPAAEFNIWVDPEAASRVFQSGVDLTMVGLDVTHRALMRPDHAQRLSRGGRAGRLVAELFAFYTRFHRRDYGWEGAPVHDALALAHVVDGTLLTTTHCGVVIDCGPELSRGRTHRRSAWPRRAGRPTATSPSPSTPSASSSCWSAGWRRWTDRVQRGRGDRRQVAHVLRLDIPGERVTARRARRVHETLPAGHERLYAR